MREYRKRVTADVLVVGGGGAGVTSAVTAARNGSRVAMAVKGKVGRSGNLIMMGGSFGIDGPNAREYCGELDANLEYTKEKLFEKLVSSAFQIGDQKLQSHFLQTGPKGVKELLDWGRACGQKFLFMPKACRWRTSGISFGNALRHGLQSQKGIEIYEDVVITDLLTRDGQVCGALGLDVYGGELIEFSAKAVVMATGGYQPFSLKNTISDMTGDGIAMALRAGARVKDMEFLLFIPTIVEPQNLKGSILPFQMTMPNLFPLREKATDLDGVVLEYPSDERYKTDASSSKVKKLLMTYFYGLGVYAKWDTHGNRFYFDYSSYSDSDIYGAFESFYAHQVSWYSKGKYQLIDLQGLAESIVTNKKRLMVGMGNEYSMGGVIVDPTFATDVPGLFAAGEVTAGLFGAFRSADGLTEMLAHGLTAGGSASEYAKGAEFIEAEDLEIKVKELMRPIGRDNGLSPAKSLNRLESICDEGFNFFRDGKRLEKANKEMADLMESLEDLSVPKETRYNLELVNSIALRNLVQCCTIGIHAAMERKESRGCHIRSDYPEVKNSEYQFSYTAQLGGDGKIHWGKEYPEAPYKELDKKDYDSLPDCISESILGR